MKYLLLIATLLTVIIYFAMMYFEFVKSHHLFKKGWVELIVNIYFAFMIVSLSIVLRYIF